MFAVGLVGAEKWLPQQEVAQVEFRFQSHALSNVSILILRPASSLSIRVKMEVTTQTRWCARTCREQGWPEKSGTSVGMAPDYKPFEPASRPTPAPLRPPTCTPYTHRDRSRSDHLQRCRERDLTRSPGSLTQLSSCHGPFHNW